jgi:acyl-coenzyme A thioesterase PaaI-like protein
MPSAPAAKRSSPTKAVVGMKAMTELPNPFGEGQLCFACSPDHPAGFHLKFSRAGEWIHTQFLPTDQYEGPPGIMHGGLVTTLADEVAAWAVIGLKGKFGFTAEMRARLHAPVRTGHELQARSRISLDGSRLVKVEVELSQQQVVVYTGEFSFILVDRAGAEKVLQRPLPPAWERFLRDEVKA